MTITNYNDKYIKIKSDYLLLLINNPTAYQWTDITGNINCCTDDCGEINSTSRIIATTPDVWTVDFNEAVSLNKIVEALYVRNNTTLIRYNAIDSVIDLGYVNTTCASDLGCTMQSFSGYFTPLFQDQINAWFASQSITATVTVTFGGNKLHIHDLPTGWSADAASLTNSDGSTPTEEPFTYGSLVTVESEKAFLSNEALYIKPQMFGLSTFIDGIYSFTIKTTKVTNGGFLTESSCAFIDMTLKCKVATFLNGIKDKDDVSTIVHLLHYSLVNGSNCTCNCDDLCTVFKELVELLNEVIINTGDCGCDE